MQQLAFRIGCVGTIALLGAGSLFVRASILGSASGAEPATSPPVEIRDVEVVSVPRATISRLLELPATIQAYEEAELYAKT